jgi:hypothetical protein
LWRYTQERDVPEDGPTTSTRSSHRYGSLIPSSGFAEQLTISEPDHVHKGFFEASDSPEFKTGSTGRERVEGLLGARLAATISSAFDQFWDT